MLKSTPNNSGTCTPTLSLFLGNLSMFISEDDIENLFSQHSNGVDGMSHKKMEAKIIRTEKGMSLGYGFINMRSEAEAESAMKALNGRQFHGRPLQINWAVRNIKKTPPPSDHDTAIINSVHVKFSTLNRGHLVTEETLHQQFARYGTVVDVFVKYSCFNKVTGLQKGYAFVHYDASPVGKQSAIIAAADATGNSLVHYDCQPSNNLLKQVSKDDDENFISDPALTSQVPGPRTSGKESPSSMPVPPKQEKGAKQQQSHTSTTAPSPSHSKDRGQSQSQSQRPPKSRSTNGRSNQLVAPQVLYSPTFSTELPPYFSSLMAEPQSSYNNPGPIPYLDPYNTNPYMYPTNQLSQHEQMYSQYPLQQQYLQQQHQQYSTGQSIYPHPAATLIPHAAGHFVYAPLHPRFSSLMPSRHPGAGPVPLVTIPRPPSNSYIYPPHQHPHPRQESQSIEYRTHSQPDMRFAPPQLQFSPNIYPQQPTSTSYNYRNHPSYRPKNPDPDSPPTRNNTG